MSLRTTRASVSAPAGVGVVVELRLPNIEGLVIVPRVIQFSWPAFQPAGNMMQGLGHWLDTPVPTATSMVDDERVWLWHAWNTTSVVTHLIDVSELEVELGGPQAWQVYNSSGSPRIAAILMWYDTKRVNLTQWAAITRATSYEDV